MSRFVDAEICLLNVALVEAIIISSHLHVNNVSLIMIIIIIAYRTGECFSALTIQHSLFIQSA